jgi:hypothetical protein
VGRPTVTPGFVTRPEARALTAAVAQTDRTRRDIERLPTDWPDELPAKITAWAAATQRASWSERAYDETGARFDKDRGLSGSDTYAPAVPVGNGLMPPDAFPVDVWLRLRGFGKVGGVDIGPVYEFDWVCACGAAGGSGSGSGGAGAGVLTNCCPGAIPRTLTASLGSDCPDLNGLAVGLTFGLDVANTWTGFITIAGAAWRFDLSCSGSQWQVSFAKDSIACFTGQTNASIISCSPLHLTVSTGLSGSGCGLCGPGVISLDITVTE